MANAARGAMRFMKNATLGYSDLQIMVREATSNDVNPPTHGLLRDIARQTYSGQDVADVISIITKRINDSGRLWRHVYKSLYVLDYLVLHGSSRMLDFARSNIIMIRTLREFQYIDEDNVDCGAHVRNAAEKLYKRLENPEQLEADRAKARERSRNNNLPGGAATTSRSHHQQQQLQQQHSRSATSPASRNSDASSDASHVNAGFSEEEALKLAIKESLRNSSPSLAAQEGALGSREYRMSAASAAALNDEEEQMRAALALSKAEAEAQKNAPQKASTMDLLGDETPAPAPANVISYFPPQVTNAPPTIMQTVNYSGLIPNPAPMQAASSFSEQLFLQENPFATQEQIQQHRMQQHSNMMYNFPTSAPMQPMNASNSGSNLLTAGGLQQSSSLSPNSMFEFQASQQTQLQPPQQQVGVYNYSPTSQSDYGPIATSATGGYYSQPSTQQRSQNASGNPFGQYPTLQQPHPLSSITDTTTSNAFSNTMVPPQMPNTAPPIQYANPFSNQNPPTQFQSYQQQQQQVQQPPAPAGPAQPQLQWTYSGGMLTQTVVQPTNGPAGSDPFSSLAAHYGSATQPNSGSPTASANNKTSNNTTATSNNPFL